MFEDKNTENRKLQNLQKQNTGIVKIFISKIWNWSKNLDRTTPVRSSVKKFVGIINIPPLQSKIVSKVAL